MKEKKIDILCKELDDLFTPFNETICKGCTHCCCNHCSGNGAYLLTNKLNELREEYPFDSETGFLTPTGCALPRQKRSMVCLHYICGDIIKRVDKENQKVTVKTPLTFTVNGKEYTSIASRIYYPGDLFEKLVRDIVDKICKLRGWTR